MKHTFLSNILEVVALMAGTPVFAQSYSGQATADNVLWQRDVYRMVDLMQDQNAPLYFPPQPDGVRMNLFSLIFDKVSKDEIAVYDYIDGKEVFNDDTKVKFTELLDRFWIPYEVKHDKKNPKDSTVLVETADVPSNEVTLYYIKECCYFDQTNSSIKTKVLAFCPVLVREDETGEMRKYPLFWVPFDDVRNLLSQTAICVNDNAASRMSVADYLINRLYKGDIYKVFNLQNRNIMDYCKTPEAIRAEQERLEKELSDVGNSLWPVSRRDEIAAEEAAKDAAKETGKKAKAKTSTPVKDVAAEENPATALSSLPKAEVPVVKKQAATETELKENETEE